MANRAPRVEPTDEERKELESLGRSHGTSRALADRARIVLAAAEGLANKEIAATLKMTEATVGKWRRRFAEHRLDGLRDKPRPGAPRRISDDDVADVIRRTLEETPPGSTHWSLRSMSKAVGYAPSTIHRIWQTFCLKPHRGETLSNDPLFVEKVRDIVGLYVDPPERALVLSIDEKNQGQAVERAQPLLRHGQAERRPHERSGTASLFEALDVATGKAKRFRRHRSEEFRKFLNDVEDSVPSDLDIHIVMEQLRDAKDGSRWFPEHPRWRVHLTPTSASWIDQVERFFCLLTEKRLKRDGHRPTADLEGAIRSYIDTINDEPFRWTGG